MSRKSPLLLRSLIATLLLAGFACMSVYGQTAAEAIVPAQSVDQQIDAFFGKIADAIFGVIMWEIPLIKTPFIVAWLTIAAITFTLYFKFINFRQLGFSLAIVRGRYTDPNEAGEVSHFQALATALSGTVGLGNIAGVAIAISMGGPGATFWMIVAGLLGMSSKFVECTLGVSYRDIDKDGRVYGGPMYYLSKGLREKGFGKIGRVLAIMFAVFCIGGSLGGGNMFQVNQAYTQLRNVTGGEESLLNGYGWVFGVFIASIVGLVIIGGIQSIARATSKIVPFMCSIYVIAALAVIITNIGELPNAISLIFVKAFNPDAAVGGVIGCMVMGFRRAGFSNEAGVGSASIAHAAVKTNYPASEGLVSLLEPFIDTVIVCTMTALVIIITGQYGEGSSDGVAMTSNAFESVFSWFPILLVVAVTLFAFSTMISWSYYGEQAWCYLFGNSNRTKLVFKLIFCSFVVVGAASSLNGVLNFSDAMIFAMAFPNIIGLYILMPRVRAELDNYTKAIDSGKIVRHRSR